MLTPSNFARAVVPHGTVAVVADCHEIANVLGVDGIAFMINNSKLSPMKLFFAAPSCVPATPFETAGATVTSKDIAELMQLKEVVCLGEMMNFPGVINNDHEVLRKLIAAKRFGKPIDGHCPGLSGDALKKYVDAGISTDHECTSLAEAEEKVRLGMKILIREGSSAKNMAALINIAKKYDWHMFVSDDIHADDLAEGHMNILLKKAVSLGLHPVKAVRMVTLNPVRHYKLGVGLLQIGDDADIAVVDNLRDFNVIETWIKGNLVASGMAPLFESGSTEYENNFIASNKNPSDFKVPAPGGLTEVNCITAVDGQIVTGRAVEELLVENGSVVPDETKDVLKIAVLCRYGNNKVAAGFVKGFGLKRGAIASSVAHDSHNIIAVGTNDADIAAAVNRIIEKKGGLAVANDGDIIGEIALPVAGLMSANVVEYVSGELSNLSDAVKLIGCRLRAPFMTLSFMALPVIPELKITDMGLFDVTRFEFLNVVVKD